MNNLPHPRHNSFPRFIVPLLCLSAGVALGLFLAKKSPQTPTTVAESKAIETTATSAKNKSTKNTIAATAPTQTALDLLRAACSDSSAIDFATAITSIRELTFDDVRAALKFIQSIQNDERRALFEALANRWVTLDPNDAFTAALNERRDHDWRNRLGRAAGAALVASDPEAALKAVSAVRRQDLRGLVAQWVLYPLAKTDPAGAADFCLADKSLVSQGDVVLGIAREFGRVSPQEAFAWAEKIPALRTRQAVTKTVWMGWALENPAAAAAALNTTKQGADADIFDVVGQAWSRSNPEAALAWAQSLADKPSRERALRSIYLDVEKLGPDKARSLVESITDVPLRRDYAARIAEQLAKSGEVSDAIAWAQTFTDAESKASAIDRVVHEWAAIDPAAATRYAAEMPAGKNRTDVFAQAFAQWAQAEPDEAFAYGQQLPPGKDRDVATARAIDAMRDSDPQKALQWFEQLEDPKLAREVAQGLLGSLVRVDQDAAFRIAANLPPEAQPDAYHGIVRSWAFDYPKEAGNWVNSLPPGQARDSAVKAYVSVIDGMDAGAATQWAYSIQDPTMRIETTMEAFQRWLGNDHGAAAEWLQNTDLPEDLRPFFERELNQKTKSPLD
jgi:hypothetical protein